MSHFVGFCSNLEDNMIRWVITLPAIWRDEAKHFMREAAKQVSFFKKNTLYI